MIFRTYLILQRVLETQHGSEKYRSLGVTTCKVCHFKTSDQGTFQTHICRKKNKDSESNKITIKFTSRTSKFICSHCSFEADENEFVEHLQTHLFHHPFRCDTCKEGCRTRHLIQKHCEEKHLSTDRTFTLKVSHLSKGILSGAKKNGLSIFTPFTNRSEQRKENEAATLQNNTSNTSSKVQSAISSDKAKFDSKHKKAVKRSSIDKTKYSKTVPTKDIIDTVCSTSAYHDSSHSLPITNTASSCSTPAAVTTLSTQSNTVSSSRSSSYESTSSPIISTHLSDVLCLERNRKNDDYRTTMEKDSNTLFNSTRIPSENTRLHLNDVYDVHSRPVTPVMVPSYLMSQSPIVQSFDRLSPSFYPYCFTAPQPQHMSRSDHLLGLRPPRVSTNSQSPHEINKHITSRERTSSISGEDSLSVVKQENLDFSYLRVVNNMCICLMCKEKFSDVHMFYRHIHKRHIYTPAWTCCPSGLSLDCPHLERIISVIDSACSGQLKRMDSSREKQFSDPPDNVKKEFDESGNLLVNSSISQDCHNASIILQDYFLRPGDQVRHSSCESINDNLSKINKHHSSFDSCPENPIPSTNPHNPPDAGNIQRNESIDEDNDLEQYHQVLNHQMTKNFYKCCFTNCGYSNHEALELLMHTEAKHGNEMDFYCIYCGYKGTSVTEFVDHINVHNLNKIEKYLCSILLNNHVIDTVSKRKLDDLMSFLEVKYKEHEGCYFQCNICDCRFSSKSKLKDHLKISALKTFDCRLCRSTFLDSKSFESHSTKVHPGSAKFQRVNLNFLCQFRKQHRHSFCRILRQQITNLIVPIETETEIPRNGNNPVSMSSPTVSFSSASEASSPPNKPDNSPSSVTDGDDISTPLINNDSSNSPIHPSLNDSSVSDKEKTLCNSSSSNLLASSLLSDADSQSVSTSHIDKDSLNMSTQGPASSDKAVCNISSASDNLSESTKDHPVDSLAAKSSHSTTNNSIAPSFSTELSMKTIMNFSMDNTLVSAPSQHKPSTVISSDNQLESITVSQFNESPAVSSFLSSLSSVRTMLSSTMPSCMDLKRKCDNVDGEGNVQKKLKPKSSDLRSGEMERTQQPASPVGSHYITSSASIVSLGIVPVTGLSVCTSTSSQSISMSPCSSKSNSVTQSSTACSDRGERYSPDMEDVSDVDEEPELVIDIDTTCQGMHNDLFLPSIHFTDSVAEDDKENEKVTTLYRCKLCSYICEWNEWKMKSHISNDKHKYFACRYCENPYFELRLLKNHIRFQHGDKPVQYEKLGIEHIFSPKVDLKESRKSVHLLAINSNNTIDSRVLEDEEGLEKALKDDNTYIEPVIKDIVKRGESLSTAGTSNDVSYSDGSTQDFVFPERNHECIVRKKKTVKQFGCKRCRLYFASLCEVEQHSLRQHKKAKVKWIDHLTDCIFTLSGRFLRGNITEIPAKPYLCGLCTYRSENRSGVHAHFSLIHSDHSKGPVVIKLHGFSSAIRIRINNKPVEALDYDNGLTSLNEPTSHETLKNIGTRKDPSCYNCHLCPSKLSSEFFFRLHLAKHKGFRHMSTLTTLDGLLICSKCSYIARSNLDLANHVSTHVTDRRYKCSLCEFESHRKKSINSHIIKHGPDSQAKVHDREKKRGKMKLKVVNLNPTVLLKRLRCK